MKYRDQLGRTINLTTVPKRIISLVPSQTELLHDLGLDDEVIGITKFCIHPQEWFAHKVRVGGTKKLNIDIIRKLNPDLIIGNKEENEQAQLEMLMEDFPVWISDVNDLNDALNMIASLGEITATNEQAEEMVQAIKKAFSNLENEFQSLPIAKQSISAAYLIWYHPWMAAGSQTFINDMLKRCHIQNCFSDQSRYPDITLQQLKEKKCNLILLSSEPFPFKEKHADEIRASWPDGQILFVDGEMFSWYGSRLLQAPAYFGKVLTQLHTV